MSAEYTNISGAMRRKELYSEAPVELVARVRSHVLRGAVPASPEPRWGRRWRMPVFAGLSTAAVGLAALIVVVLLRPAPGNRIAEQVVASHIRSLMASHLTDVESTDQHTVKPWFSGRIDFSPEVRDLAASGFPLAGGRLDYIDGRPVAALVYMHRLHRINLFQWPAKTGDSAVRVETIDGYNVIHWTRSHMSHWAISDLNARELGSFAEQLQVAP